MKNIKPSVAFLLLTAIFVACGVATPNLPTQTKLPAASETPKPSPTITALPTITAGPSPTLSRRKNYLQNISNIQKTCQNAFGWYDHKSWNAYDCQETSEMFIVNRTALTILPIKHAQFSISTRVPDRLDVDHWSNNNQYIYLIPIFKEKGGSCCWDPSGGTSIDFPMSQLWQFNLNTGKQFNVFEKVASIESDNYPSGSTTAYSSDDKTLLIIAQRRVIPPVIYVYDLEKNKIIRSLELAGSEYSITAGNVVWSPDGQRFAIASAYGGDFERGGPFEDKDWTFSVIVVDLKNMSQKVIIRERKGDYISLKSITNENILNFTSQKIYDPTSATGMGAIVNEQYDLTTNRFLIPTPTP